MNTGRLVGVILIVVGFGIAVIAGLWLALQVQSFGADGVVIGAAIAFIPVALLVGGGIYMYVIGSREAVEESSMHQQRQLLDIVKSRGQVAVADLAIEMKTSADNVKNLLHQLVGLQVFSGYVNWEKGVIYSSDAKQLRELDKCKNCGGEIKLVGKGVVTCRFCGTEYFLS